MKSEFILFIGMVFGFLFVVDLYAYKAFRLVFLRSKWAPFLRYLYWGYSIAIYLGILLVFSSEPTDAIRNKGYGFFQIIFAMMILSLVPKLILIVFHFLEDVGFLSQKVIQKVTNSDRQISRRSFLTKIGFLLASIPFCATLYGIFWGRHDYVVKTLNLSLKELPKAFNGLKVVQFSDAHLGSFQNNTTHLRKAFQMINALQPDLILFTGDLVNHFASELNDQWLELFGSLKASLGKFCVLGNHDYSDYMRWDDASEKKKNLDELKQFFAHSNFRLLLNEHVKINSLNQEIELVGVENWGKGRFAKYGDLAQALQGTNANNFQILLSHDPSHWDAEVLGKSKINLTLSGHTHGLQFGINLKHLKYSPVQHRYPRWMGLYEENNQLLYVNPGIGYLGFPARVGIRPEITLFELNAT